MSRYEMFPQGMWHMLGAIMLMVFASAARYLYNSRAYQLGVEYYRLIWARHRAGTSGNH